MTSLVKVGLILSMASTITLMPKVSLAGDFDLTFNGSSSLSTIASNAVVRGDRDRYYFSAQAGQRISIAVTSLEDNAVIDLLYKSGETWIPVPEVAEGDDRRIWYGALPSSDSDQYQIVVSGTRGNATYDLFVGISQVSD